MQMVSGGKQNDFRQISLLATMRYLSHQLRAIHDNRIALLALLTPSRMGTDERQEVLSSLCATPMEAFSLDQHDAAVFSTKPSGKVSFSSSEAIQDVWELCAPYFPVWGEHNLENAQFLQGINANRSMFYALILNLLLEVRRICQTGGDISLSGMPSDNGVAFSLIVSAPELVETDWLKAILSMEDPGDSLYETEVRILHTALQILQAEIRVERKNGAPVVGGGAEEYVPEMLVLHISIPEDVSQKKTAKEAKRASSRRHSSAQAS